MDVSVPIPYVVHLLDLNEFQVSAWHKRILNGDKSNIPGMVRISFGCYNNTQDIDRLVGMLERVARRDYRGDYRMETGTGEYLPIGYNEPLAEYFLLGNPSESNK